MSTPNPSTPVTGPAAAAAAADTGGSLAAHVTAIVNVVLGLIALLHPGFHEPAVVQAAVAPTTFGIAAVVEIVHIATHRGLKAALAAAWADVEKWAHVRASTPPSAPVAPAPKAAATPAKAPAAKGAAKP